MSVRNAGWLGNGDEIAAIQNITAGSTSGETTRSAVTGSMVTAAASPAGNTRRADDRWVRSSLK